MKSAQVFINAVLGKAIDMDGAYGAQCWDLFAYFCKEAGYPIFNCTTTGFAKDLWNNRNSSGIVKYFKEVSVMQKGDWCIWGNCAACPDSHIAMFVEDIDGHKGRFCGQNQGGVAAASLFIIPYEGNLGALRPNAYQAPSLPYAANGAVKALYNDIRVRTAPSTSKGDTGLRYDTGQVLYYDAIVPADGWYWAKYARSAGGTGYCALCKIDGTSKYWRQA